MITKQKLEQVLYFCEQNNNHAYYLLARRCEDVQAVYDFMRKRYYNPFKSKDNYISFPLLNTFVRWLFNRYFRNENKNYTKQIKELLDVKNYFEMYLRKKIEQEKDDDWRKEGFKSLEEAISQVDNTIATYKSIIKRIIKK